ncbi:hypothetical protein OfM1_00130 [Lactovum odontotermitis]
MEYELSDLSARRLNQPLLEFISILVSPLSHFDDSRLQSPVRFFRVSMKKTAEKSNILLEAESLANLKYTETAIVVLYLLSRIFVKRNVIVRENLSFPINEK